MNKYVLSIIRVMSLRVITKYLQCTNPEKLQSYLNFVKKAKYIEQQLLFGDIFYIMHEYQIHQNDNIFWKRNDVNNLSYHISLP